MGQTKPGPISAAGRCPICRDATDPHYRPFCSKRCADIDLSRWLRGAYHIPGGQADADEDGDDALAQRTTAADKRTTSDEDE